MYSRRFTTAFLIFVIFACGAPARAGAATLSIAVSGNHLVNGSGQTVQLRGVNYSGFESTAIQGWDPSDPSGGQAGAGGPSYSAIQGWGANVVRLPLNEASWLQTTCVDTSGVSHQADPGGNYRSAIATQVQQATALGIYVILDLHWAAPGSACPMLQTQMADQDNSLKFWTSLAQTYAANSAVIFELYNEPYMDGLTGSETDWPTLMQGGTFAYYDATSGSSNWQQVNTGWTEAGMQAMINTIRATGATNVVLVAGQSYNNDLSQWLANEPTDSLGQMGASWHPYPPEQFVASVAVASGGSGYAVGDTITMPQPNTVYTAAQLQVTAVGAKGVVTAAGIYNGVSGIYLQTSLPSNPVAQGGTSGKGSGASFNFTFGNLASQWSMPSNWPTVQAIAAKVPVVITETGENNAPGARGSPFLQQLLPWADSNGISYIGWAWDVWQNTMDVLITSDSGTPSAGYGQYFHDHLVCLNSGGSNCGSGGGPALSLNPGSLSFGSQALGTTSAAQVLTLSNSGSSALTISSVSISGAFAQTNTCGSSVAAGASCSFSVTFKPTANGAASGTLSISSNATGSPSTVSLSGTGGSAQAALSLSTTTLSFGSQPVGTTSNAQAVTLTNTGSAALSITQSLVTGAFAQSNSCGSSVAAGASCTLNVSFKPTSVGAASGSVQLTSNAGSSSIGLSGTGSSSSGGLAQPYFASFAPASGPVGTIVTVSGSGFTGLTHAYIGGTAHSMGFTVLSDSSLLLMVPAGGATGQLAVFNPQHAAWSPSSFQVTK